MKFKSEKIQDKGIGKWYVIIDETEWINYIKKAEKKTLDQLKIPGFRKGKVPVDLLKRNLIETKILNTAHNLVVNKACQFAFNQKSHIEPFSPPIPSIKKINNTEYVLQLKFDLKPEIKINKYTGFIEENLKKEKIEVKNTDIIKNINQLRNRFAIFKPKTSKIVKNDTVIFDFEGFVNGKTFKGGKATNFALEIGSGQFIPGFEEAMIGLKIGDEKEINIIFPDNYHIEELKSIPAIFKIKIKEIKTKELPELNDELAKNVNLKGIDTLDKLKIHIKNNIYEQLLKQKHDNFINELFKLIIKNSKIILPESIIRKKTNQLKQEFEQKLQSQQLNIKIYKKRTGMSEKDIFNELFKDAKNKLENSIIVDTIIKNEKITATEAEINKQYEKIVKKFETDGDETLKENKIISKQQIKEQIINDKVFLFLYQNNGK